MLEPPELLFFISAPLQLVAKVIAHCGIFTLLHNYNFSEVVRLAAFLLLFPIKSKSAFFCIEACVSHGHIRNESEYADVVIFSVRKLAKLDCWKRAQQMNEQRPSYVLFLYLPSFKRRIHAFPEIILSAQVNPRPRNVDIFYQARQDYFKKLRRELWEFLHFFSWKPVPWSSKKLLAHFIYLNCLNATQCSFSA